METTFSISNKVSPRENKVRYQQIQPPTKHRETRSRLRSATNFEIKILSRFWL